MGEVREEDRSLNPGTVLQVVASLRGGAARHTFALAEGLRTLGWRVILVSPDDCRSAGVPAETSFDIWEILPLDRLPGPALAGLFNSAVKRYAPLVIHSHGLRAGTVARIWRMLKPLLGRSRGRPALVYTVHGLHFAFAPNPVRKWAGFAAEKLLSIATDRIIAVSRSDRDLILKLKLAPQRKVAFIPNAVDPAPFRQGLSRFEARSGFGVPGNAFVVGTLARLHPQKAIHVLLEATARLRSELPDLYVLIGGDGPLQPALKSLSRRLGLEKTVRFLGEVSDPPRFYRCLDVFCLPSLWEGMPLTILEAAAAGVPVVATAVPGIRELLDDGKTALLTPSRDPVALARAVVQLKRDPVMASRLTEQAARSLEAYFHPELVWTRVADLYAEVLEQKGVREKT